MCLYGEEQALASELERECSCVCEMDSDGVGGGVH